MEINTDKKYIVSGGLIAVLNKVLSEHVCKVSELRELETAIDISSVREYNEVTKTDNVVEMVDPLA